MSRLFFAIIVWWERITRKELWSVRWAEFLGYRRACGGRWGLWEFTCMGSPLRMWWPSPCEHYPAPPLANSTEPLESEDYTTSCGSCLTSKE